MVALVRAEVVSEPVDAFGEQRDLDFGRAGVIGGALELRDHSGFLFSGERHQSLILQNVNIYLDFAGANSTEKLLQSIGLGSVVSSRRRGCNRPSERSSASPINAP